MKLFYVHLQIDSGDKLDERHVILSKNAPLWCPIVG